MNIQYRNKVGNSVTLCFAPGEGYKVHDALRTVSGLRVTLSTIKQSMYTSFDEIEATAVVGDIDLAIKALGATPLSKG